LEASRDKGNAVPEPVQPVKATWNEGTPPLSKPDQYGDFAQVAAALAGMGIPPDFESDAMLRYTHRKVGEAEIYFVANPEDRPLTAHRTFRVSGKKPELWDAISGEVRVLPEFAFQNGRTSVPLRFEPHQSFFIVFRRPAAGEVHTGRNFPDLDEAAELSGSWEVSFDPKWGGPEKVTFAGLEDWSRRPEEGIKFYSGMAIYRKTFDLPTSAEGARKTGRGDGPRIWLDLGVVKNIARVSLNGRDLGVIWCAPWRVDITAAAKPKANRLEVTVANLWPNRLIGDELLPPDAEFDAGGRLLRWPGWLLDGGPRPVSGRYTFTTWRHFSKDSALLPSGFLGPATLRTQRPG
jgi:hypothetical protein